MTDHKDPIRRLDTDGRVYTHHEAADAIKELVAERDDWRRSLDAEIDHHALTTTLLEKAERECTRLGFVVDAQVRRAEKAEAELAAARAALRDVTDKPWAAWEAMHKTAIAAARAEKGGE